MARTPLRPPRPCVDGIPVKKHYGQHFLRDSDLLRMIITAASIEQNDSVFEIGCGDGVLTEALLATDLQKLIVFEIDHEWATYVRTRLPDKRLEVREENILQLSLREQLKEASAWKLVANLPYNITFPILRNLFEQKELLHSAVIMIQAEVAEKLLNTSGRSYGPPSLFYQCHFEITPIVRVGPKSFYPSPKVHSQVVRMVPRQQVEEIPEEESFWDFIAACFVSPRRMLHNSLMQGKYDPAVVKGTPWEALRAQQMTFKDFLALWDIIRLKHKQ